MFGMRQVDKKVYEEQKNYFLNLITKERRKI